jgi:hypothetical protein
MRGGFGWMRLQLRGGAGVGAAGIKVAMVSAGPFVLLVLHNLN